MIDSFYKNENALITKGGEKNEENERVLETGNGDDGDGRLAHDGGMCAK